MHFPWLRSRRSYVVLSCLVLGSIACGLGAVSRVLERNFFDSVTFGRRPVTASDAGVAAYAADVMTGGIVRRKPDLVAFRPVLLSVTESLVSTNVFRSMVERAAQRAHQAALSEGSQRLLLSLPDLNILIDEAIRNASPGLAAKIPGNLDSVLGGLADAKRCGPPAHFEPHGQAAPVGVAVPVCRWCDPVFPCSLART